MAISTPVIGELRLALDEILVRENVREIDAAHVDDLAPAIALVPLIVRPVDAVKHGLRTGCSPVADQQQREPSEDITVGLRPR